MCNKYINLRRYSRVRNIRMHVIWLFGSQTCRIPSLLSSPNLVMARSFGFGCFARWTDWASVMANSSQSPTPTQTRLGDRIHTNAVHPHHRPKGKRLFPQPLHSLWSEYMSNCNPAHHLITKLNQVASFIVTSPPSSPSSS